MKKRYIGFIFWTYILILTIYSVVPIFGMTKKIEIIGFELRLDYWLHLGAYFGVAFLLIIWQINYLVQKQFSVVILAFFVCMTYAYLTEIVQYFIPSRTYNIYDFVANASGILLAYLLFIALRKYLRRSKLRFIIT